VCDAPSAGALSVQAMALDEDVEPSADEHAGMGLGQPRQPITQQRGGIERPLSDERLRVDRQPRLTGRAQDVAGVEILVEHDGFAL